MDPVVDYGRPLQVLDSGEETHFHQQCFQVLSDDLSDKVVMSTDCPEEKKSTVF